MIEGYSSCIDFQTCTFQAFCTPSKEIRHLQNLLNALFFTSPPTVTAADIFSSSSVALTSLPYSGFLQPALITALDDAIDPLTVNASDPWFWSKVSASGPQLNGFIKPNTTTTNQCDISIELKTGSLYSITDIRKITGLRPSTVTTAPAGAFVGYALLRNATIGSGAARWEPITGTLSVLSSGKCGKDVNGLFQIDPVEPGGNIKPFFCPANHCDGTDIFTRVNGNLTTSFSTYILSGTSSTYYFGLSSNSLSLTTVLDGDPCINLPWASPNYPPNSASTSTPGYYYCSNNISIPAGSGFDFTNVTNIVASSVNFTLTNGPQHNHYYVILTYTTGTFPSIVTHTTIGDGFIPCIDFPVCNDCTSGSQELLVNGDFENGKTGFYSEFTEDVTTSLAKTNYTGINLPYAASPYGLTYNVYNIKPVWNCYSNTSGDHTSYFQVNPTTPPSILTCTGAW